MAKKTVITYVADVDGGRADQRVAFGLDVVGYGLDLSDANDARLHAGVEQW
ncbi:Lsr2 dimerization domain-containing protein [Luteipulveratus halotolerans]|uniref:Lsr2 dimerization domain-containing protein n=1 Tax=Luteipulveratus halotolerans TaxID=1631356 RepID=UPI0009E35B85|nr:histone-like nucleoid-structuring protein Lsr2 [Luteipulveratus halotolerans]